MPRAFTPAETADIRRRLLAAATESFGRRGLRGTSVESLARTAGISKGAFYAFFASKEELVVALLDEHEARTHAELEAAVRANPARGVEAVLVAALHASEHPVASILMTDDGLAVLRALPEQERERLLRRDEEHVRRVAAALAQAGQPLAVAPDVLLALLRTLVFAGLHREDVGPELLDTVQDWLAALLRAALLGAAPNRER